jgi:hypothetical protein
MELVGKAMGGPRDGVKLMCPSSWNGRVAKPVPGPPVYYKGHYAWDSDFGVWVWHVDRPATALRATETAKAETPHQW